MSIMEQLSCDLCVVGSECWFINRLIREMEPKLVTCEATLSFGKPTPLLAPHFLLAQLDGVRLIFHEPRPASLLRHIKLN
jgi:hypothetical protein